MFKNSELIWANSEPVRSLPPQERLDQVANRRNGLEEGGGHGRKRQRVQRPIPQVSALFRQRGLRDRQVLDLVTRRTGNEKSPPV